MKTKRTAPAKHAKAKPTAKRRPTPKAGRTSTQRKAFDLDAFCAKNQLHPGERYRRFMASAEAEAYQGRYVTGLPGWNLAAKIGLRFVKPSAGVLEDLGLDRAQWPTLVPLAALVGEADVMAVDCAHPDGPVFYLNHEIGVPEPVAATLDGFLSSLLEKGDKTPFERAQEAAKRGLKAYEAKRCEEAVALLSPVASDPLVANLRPQGLLREGAEEFAQVLHVMGCALDDLGRAADAEAALRKAVELESETALLSLMSFCLERGRFAEVIALGKDAMFVSAGDHGIYWCERYLAEAYLRTGDRSAAEGELRALLGKFAVEDETKIDEVRARLEKLADGGPGTADAKEFLAWFKPLRASSLTAEERASLRAWWDGLPSHGAHWQPLLGAEVKLGKGKSPSDDQLLRMTALESLNVEEPKGAVDVTPLARLSRLRHLTIKGDARSLEPLRGLTELTTLSLGGKPTTLAPLRALPKLFSLEVNQEDILGLQLPAERSGKLFAAIENDDVAAAKRALDDGASLFDEIDGRTPLRAAIRRKSLRLVQLLVEQGAAVPAREQTLPWKGNPSLKPHAAALDELHEKVLRARRLAEGFRLWTPRADAPDACTLEELEGFKFYRLLEGKPCLDDFPKRAFCPMLGKNAEQRKRTALLDCHDAGGLVVVSKGLKRFLETNAGTRVEYLPIQIRDYRKKTVSNDYFVVNPLAQDCLDPMWSRPIGGTTYIDAGKRDFNAVTRLAIDEKRAAQDRPLFRLNVLEVPLIIRRDLADALTQAGFTGLGFRHLVDLYDAKGERAED